MACSPVGLFRLMDRKLSLVGTKVRGWFPVKLKFFSGPFSAASVVHSTAKIMFTFTQLTCRFVAMNRIYLFCLLFDYLEVYGLLIWFLWAWVKNHRNKKIQRPTNNCCQVKIDICSIHIFVSFFCCCSVQIWRLHTTPPPPHPPPPAGNSLGLV